MLLFGSVVKVSLRVWVKHIVVRVFLHEVNVMSQNMLDNICVLVCGVINLSSALAFLLLHLLANTLIKANTYRCRCTNRAT